MEQPQGLKGILLDALGLVSEPEAPAPAHQEPAGDDAADAEADAADPAAGASTADAQGQSKTDRDAVFASRLAIINQQYASDASAARDAEQLLQEAHLQAQQKEAEVLAAADAAYTPAWRKTGLPSKASQLQLDEAVLSAGRLLKPAAIMSRQQAHQQKEVLQPPAVFAYCDKTAAPHFLQTTGNQKVREGIAAARRTARSPHRPRQKQQVAADDSLQQQQKQKQEDAAGRSGSPGSNMLAAARQQQTSRQALAASSADPAAAVARVPWSELPPNQAAAKVAAAQARYNAMSAIMTPEQRQTEEKIIKSMHQRLSFLRNPRYASQPAQAAADAASAAHLPLKGTSTAHTRRLAASRTAGSPSRSQQPGPQPLVTPSEAGFAVVPAQGVLFDAYEPGGAYFQTVQLQNVGTVMRQLRLLPPSSRHFQVSFPRFPLESSTLAPGMCAEVDVCFSPDSLGDYADAFSVESLTGRFEVQLTGRRPHPDLTLPPVLEAGSLLVGNSRSRTFEFINKGGEGRFLLLTAQQWQDILQQHAQQQDSSGAAPGISAATADAGQGACAGHAAAAAAALAHAAQDGPWVPDAAAVCSGPFSLGPAYLDLPAGAAAVLGLQFSPQEPGPQAAEFVLVCDNCTAHPLRVEGCGEQVLVELVGLDDREWTQQDALAPLWLGQVCPGASSSRRLRVHNAADLPFPFRWTVHSSQPQPAFAVTPAAGVLQAQSEQEFTVQFAPACVAAHAAGLSLLVQRSGDAGLLSITQWGLEGTAIVDLAATAIDALGLTASLAQPQHSTGHAGACAAAASPSAQSPGAAAVQQGEWPGDSAWQPVAELAVEGVGCPLELTVLPAAMLTVPGALTAGEEACLPLQLRNDTDAAAHYSIVAAAQGAAPAADVYIAPSQGGVPPHGVLDLSAHFTALAAGMQEQGFVVQVLHGREQVLQTRVEVQQVVVVPQTPTLDFGVLCVGASATRTLELANTARSSSSHWHLQQCGEQESVPPTRLSFQPHQGVLGPLCSDTVVITVTGGCEGAHRLLVRVSSNSSACSSCGTGPGVQGRSAAAAAAASGAKGCSCSVEYVQVLVLVSSPKVALSKYRLPVKHAYTGVPQQHSVVMTNTSRLPLVYSWAVKQLGQQQLVQQQQQQQVAQLQESSAGPPACNQLVSAQQGDGPNSTAAGAVVLQHAYGQGSAEDATSTAGQIRLEISPASGQLQPGESVSLKLHLEPLAVGPVALLCCCQVPAMSQLVGLLLTAQVGGLQVRYRILQPHELPLLLQEQQQQQQQAGRRAGSCSPTGPQRGASPQPGQHGSMVGSAASAGSPAARSNAQRQLVQFGGRDAAGGGVQAGGAAAAPEAAASGVHAEAGEVGQVQQAADFGVVSLHQPAELLLQVTNLTSIPSLVRAWIGHFSGQQPAGAASTGSSWLQCGGPTGSHSTSQPGDGPSAAAAAAVVPPGSPQQTAGATGSRSSSPCSAGQSAHMLLSAASAQSSRRHRSLTGHAKTSSIAGKLSRTDPCSYTGSRVDSSAHIPGEALVSTLTSISTLSSSSSKQGAAAAAGSSTGCTDSSGSSSSGSSLTLKGPFRAFAGNAMMAARQAAAAAAAALGSGTFGCAVQLLPAACQLPGWGSCVLRLQAFNNLPGSYVDTLFVQVGDLPLQQIPVTLRVAGSPLVLNKHRVQRQGSELLHTILHHQQRQQQLGRTDAGAAPASDSGAQPEAADSGTLCGLDFGAVPTNLEVQKTFFVSNTGCLPMQLAWSWAAEDTQQATPADPHCSSSSSSSSRSSVPDDSTPADSDAAGAAAPSEAAFLLPAASQEISSVPGSRPDTAAACGEEPGGEDSSQRSVHSKGSSQAATKAAAAAAGGLGKKGTVSAPGGTAAAVAGTGAAAGAKPADGKGRAVVSAGHAAAKVGGRRESVTAAASGADAVVDPAAQGQDGSGAGPASAAAAGASEADAAAAAAEVTGAPQGPGPAAAAGGFDALLPAGGPSSVLQSLQNSRTAPCAAVSGAAGVDSAVAHPGDDSPASSAACTPATSLFSITPSCCVIPAGAQQQFVVSICSSEPRVLRQLRLTGAQSFCCEPRVCEQSSSGGGGADTGSVRLHILPDVARAPAGGSGADGQKQLQCCITGGFHPNAGPPPRPLPALTTALSAEAVLPRLSPCDPDSFMWHCSSTHSPASHPSYLQTATLCNDSGCPQVFCLAVQGPFRLVAAVPSVPQDADAFRGLLGSDSLPAKQPHSTLQGPGSKAAPARDNGLLLLPPGESVDVTVRFEPPRAAAAAGANAAVNGQRPAKLAPLLPTSSVAAAAAYASASTGPGSAAGSSRVRSSAGGMISSSNGTAAGRQDGCRAGSRHGQQSTSGAAASLHAQAEHAVAAPTSHSSHSSHSSGGQQKSAVAATDPAASMLQYQGQLLVSYITGQQQVVPLQACVMKPGLLVSSALLDFGGVHAAAPRTLELVITNPTEADAAWSALIAPASALPQTATVAVPAATAAAAFAVSPQQGVLCGRGLRMPQQAVLQVTFAPPHSGPFLAQLLLSVQGSLGGLRHTALQLQGCGVHAETAEGRAAHDL